MAIKIRVVLDFGVADIVETEYLEFEDYIMWIACLGGIIIGKNFYPMHRINKIDDITKR